jgi:NAD(P)-dependent dehydrogenase (short-subunit alcohol dehydrogenase family)
VPRDGLRCAFSPRGCATGSRVAQTRPSNCRSQPSARSDRAAGFHSIDRVKGAISDSGRATAYPADLADHDDLTRVLDRIIQDHGTAQVLVWNAAIWDETPAMHLSADSFAHQMRLGAIHPLMAAQKLATGMTQAGGGTILVTGGGLALAPEYGGAVVGLTAVKSALRGMVLAAAPEFAAQGIRLGTVTVAGTVAPDTPFDPALIAQAFWSMHTMATPAVEHIFTGN